MATCSRPWRQAGFTLVEMLIVVALLGIVAAMAVPLSDALVRSSTADSSLVQAIRAIGIAHDRAVAERRNFRLVFVAPRTIRLEREDIDANGAMTGTTVVEQFMLENGLRFLRFEGMADTPDAFGGATDINFSGTLPVMFTSDGSLVDANGDVVNGTIFVGLPDQSLSARAVTIFGVTGMMRAWHWRGSQWME